jgi:hypothetical protein
MAKRTINPKSLANLRPPWNPGDVPNPTGKNRNRPFSDRYAEIAEEVMPEKLRKMFNKEARAEVLKPGATWGDADAYGQFLQTAKGNVNAAAEVANRVEGKPPRRITLTGNTKTEVTLRVVFDRRKADGTWETVTRQKGA